MSFDVGAYSRGVLIEGRGLNRGFTVCDFKRNRFSLGRIWIGLNSRYLLDYQPKLKFVISLLDSLYTISQIQSTTIETGSL